MKITTLDSSLDELAVQSVFQSVDGGVMESLQGKRQSIELGVAVFQSVHNGVMEGLTGKRQGIQPGMKPSVGHTSYYY